MVAIEDALTYPTENDDWIKTILIGGVLSIFGFLLLPVIPVYGYIVRVIRYSLSGQPQPPVFGDWGNLFVDGLKAMVIGIVYMIVPIIVGTVSVGGSVAAMATGSRGGAAVGLGGLVLGFIATMVLSLVFGYFATVAVVNFAHRDSLGAAFDVGTITDVALSRDYAVPWLISVGIFFGAAIVSGLLNVVPILGAIVSTFVFFYVQIVAANIWAGGFNAATSGGGAPRATQPTPGRP